MRSGGNPWLLRLADADGTDEVVLKTGDVTTDLDRRQLVTTVAALELAADHALPAPRLIAADLDGSAAGTMAVLMTVLPGSSQIPRAASAARLRALGAAAGALQRVALAPRPGLELRTRALYDEDFADWRKSAGTTHHSRAPRLRTRCWPDGSKRPAVRPSTSRNWDVTAALCTVGDMGHCLPGDLLGELGRPDLNAAILTARRDAFLAAALDQLDS
jgi:hypothetical protein